MEYTVVTSKQLQRLQKAVAKKIELGWAPCGGIGSGIVDTGRAPNGEHFWAQAMVRGDIAKFWAEKATADGTDAKLAAASEAATSKG